jgi:hypothetical protein
MSSHVGECFCGAVRIEVSGEPEGMGYCHCRSCRSWSGGPVNAFSLWKPEAVRVVAGQEFVAIYQKTPVSQRQYCKKCGGHLMTNHPPLGLVDVFVATIPTLKFSRSRQLRRDGIADAGRPAEIQGFSGCVWRIGRAIGRVRLAATSCYFGTRPIR